VLGELAGAIPTLTVAREAVSLVDDLAPSRLAGTILSAALRSQGEEGDSEKDP
jgi:hypothetical protein